MSDPAVWGPIAVAIAVLVAGGGVKGAIERLMNKQEEQASRHVRELEAVQVALVAVHERLIEIEDKAGRIASNTQGL